MGNGQILFWSFLLLARETKNRNLQQNVFQGHMKIIYSDTNFRRENLFFFSFGALLFLSYWHLFVWPL